MVNVSPRIDNLIVTLVVGDETHVVVHGDLLDFVVTLLHDFGFLLRDDDIVKVERQTTLVGHAVTQVLDTVKEVAGTGHSDAFDYAGDDVTQGLLGNNNVDKSDFARDDFIHNYTAHRCFHHVFNHHSGFVNIINDNLNRSMNVYATLVVGNDGLFRTIENQSLALGSRTQLGDVVQTQHHILRRHRDRCTVGRVQDVVALEHQHLSLHDGFVAQRQVNGHLVTVEVGVERRTSQRVELNGLTLNHLGLEGLDTQTVKCRRTVEQYGVSLHDIFQDVPDDRFAAVDNLLGALHGLYDAALNELADDERLVELGGHEFRQTALAHLQFRTYHDYGTG